MHALSFAYKPRAISGNISVASKEKPVVSLPPSLSAFLPSGNISYLSSASLSRESRDVLTVQITGPPPPGLGVSSGVWVPMAAHVLCGPHQLIHRGAGWGVLTPGGSQ